jgi:small subunit ribosomal protein S9
MADQTPQDPQDPQEPTQPEGAAEEPTTPSPEEAAAAQAVPQAADAPEAEAAAEPPAAEAAAEQPAAAASEDEETEEEEPTPRVKPAIPGADLEVDIVLEGDDRPRYSEDEDPDADESAQGGDEDELHQEPIAAQIQLAEDARYRATGKRKTAIARVILKPGTGTYTINGRSMDDFFPRETLQRNIRQPLEAVGFEDRMDVVARMHGGGVSAQAGALRHGISRALLEADPNLRSELKRRGFLTRDARAKERKKYGMAGARKRFQFSKR